MRQGSHLEQEGYLSEAFWLSWGAVKEISASVFLLASLKLGWVKK